MYAGSDVSVGNATEAAGTAGAAAGAVGAGDGAVEGAMLEQPTEGKALRMSVRVSATDRTDG